MRFCPHKKPNVIKDDVETMKKTMRSVLIAFMLLATLFLVTACVDNSTPYDKNDAKGYNVSVKFDANGGYFTTNTSVIMDSYNIAQLNKNSNGMVELALLAPDNEIRGSGNFFTPAKNGYFLVGWYTERTETGKDASGNPIYTYGGKWDFEKGTYEVDPSKQYSSKEPVLTLYAAWAPMFQINFLSVSDGTEIGKYSFNPTEVEKILVPHWGDDGAMKMYNFPTVAGYTFENAYYDQAATQAVTEAVTHAGVIDEATGTVQNPTMDIYVDMMEGEWYHIYTLEQFKKHASINGSYILHTDLDFKCNSDDKDERESWPSKLMDGNFSGTIIGNGHKICNVDLKQTNSAKTNAGLFGVLGAKAKLQDLTFENITFTIQAGTRTAGSSFGLLAGTIHDEAVLENVKIENSKLVINADKAYFGTSDYAIGKFCGMGYKPSMDFSGITVELLGENSKMELITSESDNEVVVKFG